MSQKMAIFDVDDTLFNGNIGVASVKSLVNTGLFSQEIGHEIFKWFEKYKHGTIDKNVVIEKMYELSALGLKGVTHNKVNLICDSTWQSISSQTFQFASPLINLLKDQDFKIILLSGSSIEMTLLFGRSLGVDDQDIIGCNFEIKDGVYTGRISQPTGTSDQKVTALTNFIATQKLDVDWANSLAMGDNEREVGVLQLVGLPFAINPNPVLEKIARDSNWSIVTPDNVLERIKEKLYNAVTLDIT